ncbi:MAG: hypothetical protein MUP66_00485 [Candidatus Nanohaloarchaeota archaeon QJJ-5]|nr:hypothetical protein [Candidatus Nanohaloarchaeota archaeon QJJ-5]
MLKSLLINRIVDELLDSEPEEPENSDNEELIAQLRRQDRIQVEKDLELERIRGMHDLRNRILTVTFAGLVGIGLLVMTASLSLRPAAFASLSLVIASTLAVYYTGIQAASHRHVLESIIDDEDY